MLGWCTQAGNTLLLVTTSWAVQRGYKVPLHPLQGHPGPTDLPCVVRGGKEESSEGGGGRGGGGRELSQECCELTEQGDHSIINKAW